MNQVQSQSKLQNSLSPEQTKQRRATTMKMIQNDFIPANRKNAIKYLEETSLRDENGKKYRFCHDVKVFGQYSVGLELYMKFLKKLIICLCVMSAIAIIPMILNIIGGHFQNTDNAGAFDQTTLGNQKGIKSKETDQDSAKQAVDQTQVQKYLILFTDIGYCVTLTIFLVIFKFNMEITIQRHRAQVTTPQHYAVEVKGLPKEGITVDEVKKFFSQLFGDVQEVHFAREYGDTLNKFKQRAAIIKKIETQKVRLRIKQVNDSIQLTKLKKKLQKLDGKIAQKYPDVHSLNDLPINRAFIVFDRVDDKINCINQYKKVNRFSIFCYGCCLRKKYEKFFFQGKNRLHVSQPDGPASIKWENLQIKKCSRCARYLLIFVISFICFLICFVFIFYLKDLQQNNVDSEQCDSKQQLDIILKQNVSNQIRECWCANQGIIEVIRNANLRTDTCEAFIREYIQEQSLTVGLSFIIALTNFLLKKILRLLATFIRYQSINSERMTYMISIFIVFFVNTGILIIIINGDLKDTFFQQFFKNIPFFGNYIFAGDYNDFDRKWYVNVGGSIITILFVNMILPPVTGLIFFILKKMIRCCCWRKAVIQSDLNKIYKGPEYDISNSGATLLANYYIALLYSGGQPILILILTAFVFFRYWTDKCLLFRHYSIPPNYDDRLPRKIISIMPYALFLHLLFSLWFYTSPFVFPRDTQLGTDKNGNSVIQGKSQTFWNRIFEGFTIPLLIALAALIFLYGFTSIFFRIFGCCCKDKYQQSKMNLQGPYQKQKQNMRGINSYNPIKNDEYRLLMVAIDNILKTDKNFTNLDEKLKKVEEEEDEQRDIDCLIDQGSFKEQVEQQEQEEELQHAKPRVFDIEQSQQKPDAQSLQNIDSFE